MATYTGVAGTVKVAAATIAEITGFSIETSGTTIEDSALTDAASTFKVGRTSWTASIECMWDPTDTTGQNAMVVGNSMAFIFYVDGSATGKPTIEGTGIITGVPVTVSNDALVTTSFAIQGTGALTYGTAA
jgi:hypothetical protein